MNYYIKLILRVAKFQNHNRMCHLGAGISSIIIMFCFFLCTLQWSICSLWAPIMKTLVPKEPWQDTYLAVVEVGSPDSLADRDFRVAGRLSSVPGRLILCTVWLRTATPPTPLFLTVAMLKNCNPTNIFLNENYFTQNCNCNLDLLAFNVREAEM